MVLVIAVGLMGVAFASGGLGAGADTSVSYIALGDSWSYNATGSVPPTDWTSNLSSGTGSTATGATPLGYGNGGEKTVINRLSPTHVNDYFRRRFQVPNKALVTSVTMSLMADDGAVVYINGIEVVRDNASRSTDYPIVGREADSGEATYRSFVIPTSALVTGTNLIAVRLTQRSYKDTDSAFSLTLSGTLRSSDTTAPTTPGSVTSVVTGSTAKVAWNASTDAVGVTGYRLFIDGAKVVDLTGTTFTTTPLYDGTHTFAVAAMDAAGNVSPTSAAVSAAVDANAPSVPAGLTAAVNGTTVDLAWQAATDTIGVASYEVKLDGVPTTTAALTQQLASVAVGTHDVTVSARDAAGNRSAESAVTRATVDPPVVVPPPAAFAHPGVFIDGEQLDLVAAKVRAGAQPWTAAKDKMLNSGGSIAVPGRASTRYSSLSYVPKPFPVVQCMAGTGRSYAAAHPELGLADKGCQEQIDDAIAAYTDALLYVYTGNEAYARKSIEIMNAWSYTLTQMNFDQPRTDQNQQIYGNSLLQAGWTAQLLPRAAEIMRYRYDKWSAADVAQMEHMLGTAILPLIQNGWTNGANGLMSLAEGTMNIGVFNNDVATFDKGVAQWRAQAPTLIYMNSDGAWPKVPNPYYNTEARARSLWFNPTSFVQGLQAETLRDISHMMMGLSGLSNGAETARIQGVDLFGEQRDRIIAGYEYNANFVNQYLDEKARLGGAEPASSWTPQGWPSGPGTFHVSGTGYQGGWEVVYNEFVKKQGISMPQTERATLRLRPTGSLMQASWGTLTHAR